MLVEIKTLKIENQGYSRVISLDKMYVNSASVVSIVDYDGARNFLLREHSSYSNERFSLIKVNEGGKIQEIIAFGSADKLFASFNNTLPAGKRILND